MDKLKKGLVGIVLASVAATMPVDMYAQSRQGRGRTNVVTQKDSWENHMERSGNRLYQAMESAGMICLETRDRAIRNNQKLYVPLNVHPDFFNNILYYPESTINRLYDRRTGSVSFTSLREATNYSLGGRRFESFLVYGFYEKNEKWMLEDYIDREGRSRVIGTERH